MTAAAPPGSASPTAPTRRHDEPTEPATEQSRTSLPMRIGRFAVLRRLGEGGMGVVYSAFDEELDRRVAIKLVRAGSESTSGGEKIQARIQREAQAIARVSHPNVVAVYEVGRHDGSVFVAMEYVRGKTLREWQLEQERSWAEVLDVYRQAGAGLAAAHAAGLIHRDFKPDNVMLGDADGRVRVLDFGLARATGDTVPSLPRPDVEPFVDLPLGSRGSSGEVTDDGSRPLERLTRTGAVLGTPAYMAPEQFLGRDVDARTDIFSFCVALYEGLYGERPFEGDTRIALLHHVVEGIRRPEPTGTAVPRWVHEAVVQGLSPDPDDRPSSMDELLSALARDPRHRRRRLALGLGAAMAIASAATLGVLAGSTSSGASPCEGLDLPLREAWSDDTRAGLATELEAVDVPFAALSAARVVQSLDDYAARWGALRHEACAATRIRGEQSEARLDRAMTCLDDRRRAFEALLGELHDPDAQTVAKAPTAVEALPGLEVCTDARYLDAQVEPPPDRLAQDVAELRERLSQGQVQLVLGHTADARASFESVVEAAREIDYAPLRAEAALELGIFRSAMRDVDEAVVDLLLEAATAAEASGASQLQARAYVYLSRAVASVLQRPDEALRWDALAEASLHRLGDAAADDRALLLTSRAERASAERDYPRARELLEEARQLSTRRNGEGTLQTATSTLHLGQILAKQGRFQEGKAAIVEALAVLERELGPEHPLVVEALSIRGQALMEEGNAVAAIEQLEEAIERTRRAFGPRSVALIAQLHELAAALASLDQHERAVALAQEAYEIAVEVLGPDHVETGYAAHNLSGELFGAHEFERAREIAERAVEIHEAHFSPEHIHMASLYDLLGGLAFMRRDFAQAEHYATAALDIRRRVHDGPHPEVGSAISNLGHVYEAEGKLGRAEEAYRESLTIRRASVGPDHPGVARTRVRLGRTVLAQGRASEALEHFEDARRIHEVHRVSQGAQGETHFWIAKAHRALGDSRAARQAAQAARAAFSAGNDQAGSARVDTWLSTGIDPDDSRLPR